jgi:hypothetical protein
MLEQTSKEFRESFLLKFTKEILENTEAYRNLRIKGGVKEVIKESRERRIIATSDIRAHEEKINEIKKEQVKGIITERIRAETRKVYEIGKKDLSTELKNISEPIFRPIAKNPFVRKIPPILRIPEPELPETVRYLRPQPSAEQIDLGKLNILIRDPLVKVVECNGTEENIIVMGIMGRKKTPIILSKEEIEQVLLAFSEAAKIPVNEGLFKAAVGSSVISAVISDIVGIKFVIRKISQRFS